MVWIQVALLTVLLVDAASAAAVPSCDLQSQCLEVKFGPGNQCVNGLLEVCLIWNPSATCLKTAAETKTHACPILNGPDRSRNVKSSPWPSGDRSQICQMATPGGVASFGIKDGVAVGAAGANAASFPIKVSSSGANTTSGICSTYGTYCIGDSTNEVTWTFIVPLCTANVLTSGSSAAAAMVPSQSVASTQSFVWTQWSSCQAASCNQYGIRSRTAQCVGSNCVNLNSIQTETCVDPRCSGVHIRTNVSPSYVTPWSHWGPCISSNCVELGFRIRERQCVGIGCHHSGQTLLDTQTCFTEICPNNHKHGKHARRFRKLPKFRKRFHSKRRFRGHGRRRHHI